MVGSVRSSSHEHAQSGTSLPVVKFSIKIKTAILQLIIDMPPKLIIDMPPFLVRDAVDITFKITRYLLSTGSGHILCYADPYLHW